MGQAKREKFYTVSARLVFSGIMVILIVALILGASIVINRGPILPLLGIIGASSTPVPVTSPSITTTAPNPIIVEATCSPTNATFGCLYPYFNYTTGTFTVALIQRSGYNWTSVSVRFIPTGTQYTQGVPDVAWSPPQAVNITGGNTTANGKWLTNTTKYVNIPIASGPVAVGTDITGTIWAKYQVTLASTSHYANLSSAIIVVKR
jgi:hypothetical protein